MGLFDYVTMRDPRFVCSNGHDLCGEEFQSKDFGCEMGRVLVESDRVSTHAVCLGKPEADTAKAEIYGTCTQCPAFVQFGTGNLIGCEVSFEIDLDGDAVKSIKRTSLATNDWLRDEPLARHMNRCEGPMPYAEAEQLHIHYRKCRPEHSAEFEAWATARAHALRAREPWPLSLRVGEYPNANDEKS